MNKITTAHNEFYKSIITAATDGFLLLRENGRIIDVNDAYCRMVGYMKETLLKMRLHDLEALEDSDQISTRLEAITRNGSGFITTKHRKSNGNTVDVEISIRHSSANEGILIAFIHPLNMTSTDRELEITQKRLHSIIDNITSVIYVKNPEGQYQLINKAFEDIFKISNEVIRGKTDHDIFPKKVADSVRQNDLKVLSTDKSIDFDETFQFDSDQQLYISKKFPLYDNEGRLSGLCGISTGMPEKNDSNTACKATTYSDQQEPTPDQQTLDPGTNQRFLKDIFDSLPIAITYLDSKLVYKLCNDAAAKALNKPKGQIIGKHAVEVAGDNQQIIRWLKDTLRTGEPALPLIKYTGPGGEERYYMSSYVPRKDSDGNVVGIIAEGHDITDLMQAQQQLETNNKQLEAVLLSMSEGIIIADQSGNLFHANPSSVRNMREVPKTVDDVPKYMNLMTLNNKPLALKDYPLIRTLRGETFTDMQLIRELKADGEKIIISANGTQVYEDGKVTLGIVTIRDITSQKRSADLNNALNKINEILNSQRNFDKKFQALLDKAAMALGVESATIVIKEDDHWRIKHSFNFPKEFMDMRFTDSQTSAHLLALQDGKPTVFNDAPSDKRLDQKIVQKQNFKSFMITPFSIKDSFTGGLSFHYHSKSHVFTSQEIDFAEKLGSSLKLTIRNMLLYQASQQELSRTRLLQKVATATTSSLNLNKICDKVLAAIKKHLDIRVGSIYILNEENDVLEPLALSGYPEELPDELQNMPLDQDSNTTRLVNEGLSILTHESPGLSKISLAQVKAGCLEDTRWMILPIKLKKKTAGTLALAFEDLRSFTGEEIDLCKSITGLMATAFENARLYEAEVEAKKQAKNELDLSNSLLKAASALTKQTSLQEVLGTIAEIVLEATQRSRITITLLDKENDELEVVASQGNLAPPIGMRMPLAQTVPLLRQAINEKILVIVDYEAPDVSEELKKVAASYDRKLALVVPFVFGGEVIGQLDLDEPGIRREFSKREMQMIGVIASQAAVAIENVRLFEAEQRARKQEELRAQRFEGLNELTKVRLSASNSQNMARGFVEKAAKMLNIDYIVIMMADRRKDQLVPTEWSDTLDNLGTIIKAIPLNINMQPNRVFHSSEPEFVENTDQYDMSKLGSQVLEKTGIGLRSFATLPMQGKDETFGVISFGWRKAQTFQKNDLNFYITMVNQLAAGLENVRLLTESQSQARSFEAINQMGSLISSTLNMKETLDQIADYSVLMLNSSAAAIFVRDKESDIFKVRASEGLSKKLSAGELTLGEILELKLNEHNKQQVYDLENLSSNKFFSDCANEELISALSAPIYIESELFGLVINFDRKRIALTEHESFAFNLFISQILAAINNAQRFETERLVADTLQQALLIMPKTIEKIDFGYVYNSATEMTKVGGDFYDIFEIENGQVGVIIGDVSGKGLEAATITSLVKNTIRAYAFEGYATDAVMKKTNEIIRKVIKESSFVTVFFGIIDINKNELRYCSCGHPQVILRKKNYKTLLLKTDSPVLGVLENVKFIQHNADLCPGDLVLLYTDGVTDARHKSDFFGEDRLIELVQRKFKSELPNSLPGLIFKEIKKFTKDHLVDDIAILSAGIKK